MSRLFLRISSVLLSLVSADASLAGPQTTCYTINDSGQKVQIPCNAPTEAPGAEQIQYQITLEADRK